MADVALTRQQTAARIMIIGNPAALPETDESVIAMLNRLNLISVSYSDPNNDGNVVIALGGAE